MDIQLANYGWSGLDSCSIVSNELTFSEEGIIVNENTPLTSSDNVKVKAVFGPASIDMGLVLWYNNGVGYIKFILSPTGLSLIRVYKGNEIQLKHSSFSENGLTPPSGAVTLHAELIRTNIKCYYNDNLVFNAEDNTFKSGVFGVYGISDTACTDFFVEALGIDGWESFTEDIEEGTTSIIPLPDESIKFIHSQDGATAGIYTIFPTVAGQQYTFSLKYMGTCSCHVYSYDVNSDDLGSISLSSAEETAGTLTFTATSDETEIDIVSDQPGILVIRQPQVEHKPFATSFTPDTRGDGRLSFPTGNPESAIRKVNVDKGAFSLWITPSHEYETGALPIFYYNGSFNLVYTGGNFILKYGNEILTMAYPGGLQANYMYHVIAIWENDGSISLNVYDDTTDVTDTLVITSQTISYSDNIMIGCTPTETGNLTIDTLVVYTGEITMEEMKEYREEPLTDRIGVVLKTDFSNNSLGFSKNRITIPNPKAGYPIIVEDEDGKAYERVYFIDGGEYTVYNTEKFPYSGNNTFYVEYDNLLSVTVYSEGNVYDDIEVDNNKITVNDLTYDNTDITDELLTKSSGTVFKAEHNNWLTTKPATIKRLISTGVYETITDVTINYKGGFIVFSEAQVDDIYASYSYSGVDEITIQYTPKDVFCAGYNKENDGYEVLFSNVDGKELTITYENDYGAQTKLVTTVETNPFKTANNNGFMYVTQTPIPVTSIDVTATPEALIADGRQVATITVSCFGANGAPTSNALLSVVLANGTKLGRIEKYVSKEEEDFMTAFETERLSNGENAALAKYGYFVTDEHMSGRYIYKFHVNNIAIQGTYTERIIVTETKTGIGTEIPIRIVKP